jgi:hypothetical protein
MVINFKNLEERVKYFIFSLMAAAVLIEGCSKESSTQSPAPQGTLLLDRLVVSMVPGGNETVTICAVKPDGTPDNCTITNSDPSIATATLSDSIIQITGVSYGTTNITVASGSDKSCTLPVQVYSPFVLETNDLLITFVDNFTLRWNDHGSGGTYDGSFFHPVTTNGFRALGSLACGPHGYPNPNGTYAIMVVKAKPGHEDALAEPVGYQLIYNDHGSGADMYGSFWRPIPPDGYTALGTVVANNTWNQPSLSDVVCVRSDLTMIGEATDFIYNDHGTGASMYLSCWKIDQPAAGPHDHAYLTTGTFVGVGNWTQPSTDPVMYVLKVDLPTLAEAPYQTFVPKLDGYDTPPEETVPMMAKAMLVPCSIINDGVYNGNIGWQVANSPFYRLERQVYYKLLYHNHNQTSEVQTNSVLIRSGITTTESDRIWNETSISISVEAGLSFKAFSGKITATVSHTFGYETQTSVAELQEKEVTSSINTPPGKAAALWQQYNRYILYRHNGTDLEPVTSWEIGIDSYVTDQYPDN